MSPQRRNNPDIESPTQEFPGRRQTGQETTEAERPADDNHGTVGRDEEE